MTDAKTNDLYASASAFACLAACAVLSEVAMNHTLRGAGKAVRVQSLASR